MSVKIEILDYIYTNSSNTVIDWDKSVAGELDITDHSDFPLAITFQISDFKDLTSTTGDYSKTFKIPATKNNNKILKHLYIPNISTDNEVTGKKKCRILFNNLYSLSGLIQVDGVGGYGETPSYYNCVFFGSNLSWSNKIQDTYMDAIDWGSDGEGLTYNKNSIVATWQDEDCNSSDSPIVYPITSYGDYNELGTDKTIQLLDTAGDAMGGGSGYSGYSGFYSGGGSYETPPPVSDWRPSVFVKTTLDKIFNAIGYKINSSFMDTDMFKKLVWLLPNFIYSNTDDRLIKYGYGNHFSGEGLITSSTAQADGQSWVFTEFYINLNNAGAGFILNTDRDNTGWDATTGVFTATEYGYYSTVLQNMGFYWDNCSTGSVITYVSYASIKLQLQTVGHNGWNDIDEVKSASFSVHGGTVLQGALSLDTINHKRFLNKGDKLRLIGETAIRNNGGTGNLSSIDFHLFASSSATSSTQSNKANAKYTIDIDPEPVSYGQTYNLEDVISSDYKQIDFIKGIAHAFNLQMTTDEGTKTVNIEPFDSFYKPYGDAVDWTYKLDRSNETSDKWIENDLKRTLVFKYKSDDADLKVKDRGERFFDNIQDEYPYRDTLPDTFKKGDSTFENPFFAGTYNAKDQDTVKYSHTDTAYSACLWTENAYASGFARPTQGNSFSPRLLYWNKYSPTNGHGSKVVAVQTWNLSAGWIKADASAVGVLSNIYPQATMVNRDSTTSPNLAYGDVWVRDFDDATGDYSEKQIGKGLYETYYRNMIEGLKRSPRLRTVSVSLDITDIVNLDFTKLVYIDGVYWRINRIIDYKPNKNQSTKVELIEWFQIGVFAASEPMFGAGGDWNGEGVSDDNHGLGL